MSIDNTQDVETMEPATEQDIDAIPVEDDEAAYAGRTRKKYWQWTWKWCQSYKVVKYGAPRAGWLNAGRNYVYGQRQFPVKQVDQDPKGKPISSTWWALTDDDNHQRDVWVSCLYIKGGENGQEIKNLPKI